MPRNSLHGSASDPEFGHIYNRPWHSLTPDFASPLGWGRRRSFLALVRHLQHGHEDQRPAAGSVAALGSIRMPRTSVIRRSVVVLALCATFGLSSPASGQYFGRNKVQYRTFDFQVLRTEHFDIYFYPSERAGIDISARLADRWHARL